MATYDQSAFFIDFSLDPNLTDEEKIALERIQQLYRPVERVELLLEYKVNGKITGDQFEQMTGMPYEYDM
jgi:hypothetical protein|nr:MAG TPA: major allergen I polypeptide [Caudoviricetes sp.]